MKIVLMGYMGSGKTTIGSNLAEKMDYKFIDLDQFIENMENQTISDIFFQSGAIYFRKLESQVLKEIFGNSGNVVLSLGGGTPCYGKNLELIKQSADTTSIYLAGSIPYLTERLFNQRAQRPIISQITDKAALSEFVAKHIFERSAYYLQADYKIDIDQKSIDDIISEISLLF